MWTETFTCDVCGAVRGASNHWFVAVSQPMCDDDQTWMRVSVETWTDKWARLPDVKHLCGQQCVHKFIDAALAARKVA